jgi:Cu/Ag efflux protein CusF
MECRRCTLGLFMAVGVVLCALTVPHLQAGEGFGPYETEGTIIAIELDQGFLVLDHDPIRAPGFFMNRMEMPFSVDDPALIKGLKVGDRIRFRVSAEKKSHIVELQKLAK